MASITNETTKQILHFLFLKKIYAWRNNTTGIPLPNGGFRPAAKKGTSDILGFIPPNGRFLAIEVKTGKDRLREEQIGFIQSVKDSGGIALVVKDFDEFLAQWNALVL
jgi:hypothetical protein